MNTNWFDQACRYACKLDAFGFYCWLLGVNADQLRFLGWLDTRTVPFPGNRDRTCDILCHLERVGRREEWAVLTEFQLRPDRLMLGRLMGYCGGIRTELVQRHKKSSRLPVGVVLVNLTGRGRTAGVIEWPDAGLVSGLKVVERNIAYESADAVMSGIETGRWSPCLLPWVPLMTGGADGDIMKRWKRAALREPDERLRGDFAGLALVFAAASKRKEIWVEALKEWNMKTNSVVEEWMNEGRAEGRTEGRAIGYAELLVALLAKKFPSIPSKLNTQIQATADPVTLRSWFDLAQDSTSIADFRRRAGL